MRTTYQRTSIQQLLVHQLSNHTLTLTPSNAETDVRGTNKALWVQPSKTAYKTWKDLGKSPAVYQSKSCTDMCDAVHCQHYC